MGERGASVALNNQALKRERPNYARGQRRRGEEREEKRGGQERRGHERGGGGGTCNRRMIGCELIP